MSGTPVSCCHVVTHTPLPGLQICAAACRCRHRAAEMAINAERHSLFPNARVFIFSPFDLGFPLLQLRNRVVGQANPDVGAVERHPDTGILGGPEHSDLCAVAGPQFDYASARDPYLLS